MKRRAMALTWTSPSWWTPTSTKAPKAATLVTTPSRTIPGTRSSSFSTPSAKVAVLNAGRGSRPGFSSSLRMSVTVGRPKVASTKSSGRRVRSVAVLPIRERMSPPAVLRDPPHHRVGLGMHGGGVERVVAALDAQEAGALLEGLRAEAGHLLEGRAGPERAVLVAVADDVLGQPLPDA